jgi:hypothetical protein
MSRDLFNSVSSRAIEASIPTAEMIAVWEAECGRIDEEIAVLQGQRDAYRAMIKGAQALFPFTHRIGRPPDSVGAGFLPVAQSLGDDAPRRRGRPRKSAVPQTWTAVMEDILKRLGRSSYDEMRTEIGKTHLAEKLEKTEKSFYGAIGKLAGSGLLIKHNGWLFSPEAYAQLLKDIEAGTAVDERAHSHNSAHQSPFGDAIKEFMNTKPEGALSSDIISELRKTPEFLDTIEKHKTHAYNVLSRLVDRGELVKGGGRYFPPRDKQWGASE